MMSAKQFGGCAVALALTAQSVVAAADSRLAEAVKRQDKTAARTLLAQKADPNAALADGATALHWATHWDDLEMADQLIRAGANVNAANDYGITALALACGNASMAAVERLLRAGANPNLRASTGETPLMICARTGNADTVKALVAHGAAVDATDSWQRQTPLMWASASGRTDAARVLVEGGARVDARSGSGFTPLMFAARAGDIATARLLLAAGANANDAARDGSTALLVATVRGQVAFAKFLLDAGVDANAPGPGYTALHWVAGSWHTELTGPNGIAAAREEEWRLLGGLKPEQKLELAEALLAHRANPNAPLGRNPPQYGYSSGRFKVSMIGATPFLLAAMDANTALMRLLAAAGADPLRPTKENTTPLMVAAGIGRVPAESLVTEAASMEAVKLTLELGGDVKARNTEGNTALHGAAHIRYDPLIQFLVDRGADVNVTNARGLTPLMIAEGSGHSDNPGIVGGSTATLLRKLGAR